MEEQTNSPIKSGWRSNINSHIEATHSEIKVSALSLQLDFDTAWALCNLLHDNALEGILPGTAEQTIALSNLGAAIGRLIDHPSANNGNRSIIK